MMECQGKLRRLLTTVGGGFCLAISVWAIPATPTLAAPVDIEISFDLPRAPLTLLQKKRLPVSAQNSPQGTFKGRLRIPSGSAPHPAAVVVRTCHDESYYLPWLERLNDWGYATLSFSRCQPPDFQPDDASIPSLDWKRGSLAAIGALQALAARPEIKADSIAILSWSRLGMIPLSTLQYEGFAQFFDTKFAAGIALYPFCSFARGPHMGPILIIAGAQDSWVDNIVCERVEEATRSDPFPVKTLVLDEAVHGFDIPAFGEPKAVPSSIINPDRFAANGGVLGYNSSAADMAIAEVRTFLEKHLK